MPSPYTTVPTRIGRATTPLYTELQRQRRDTSVWTRVQGVLAPVQFAIFLVSLTLVLRYLATGEGHGAATASVVVKTMALYLIMVTGCIWEKVVFDRWLFTPAFFWEDVFSMLVLALHTGYLVALATAALGARGQMQLALAAYASYAINAAQFILKLRAARLQRAGEHSSLCHAGRTGPTGSPAAPVAGGGIGAAEAIG